MIDADFEGAAAQAKNIFFSLTWTDLLWNEQITKMVNPHAASCTQ